MEDVVRSKHHDIDIGLRLGSLDPVTGLPVGVALPLRYHERGVHYVAPTKPEIKHLVFIRYVLPPKYLRQMVREAHSALFYSIGDVAVSFLGQSCGIL